MAVFDPRDFLQEFLIEAGDHLQSINDHLLSLESQFTSGTSELDKVIAHTALIDELLRSFHTLKGLTGMIGLDRASELSHAMESLLKDIQQSRLDITPGLVDLLFQGARHISSWVDTLKEPGSAEPDDRSILEAVKNLQSGSPVQAPHAEAQTEILPQVEREAAPAVENQASPAGADLELPPELSGNLTEMETARVEAALGERQFLAVAIYTPSKEKTNQNENVASIRQRFTQVGEIIKAVPLVQGKLVRFVFLVASHQPFKPEDFPEMEWKPLTAGVIQVSRPDIQKAASRPAPSSAAIRVQISVLDEMMRLVSELIINRYRMLDVLTGLEGSPNTVERANQVMLQFERNLRELRQATLQARMVPLAEVFKHMPLAVRDLSRLTGKKVQLIMQGEETELDRALVEKLLDPMLHLVRNAIIHGLESPEERLEAGKPETGSVTLSGQREGDHILIRVADDGRGIDLEMVKAAAISKDLIRPDQELSESEILLLLVQPGFTTRTSADLGSGRGLGMDIVNTVIKSMGGSLDLQNKPGQGASFVLRLPLTLTVLNAFIVYCGGQRYAIPMEEVRRIIEIDLNQVVKVEGGEIYPFEDDSIPLLRMAEVFHTAASPAKGTLYGLVFQRADSRFAVVVDALSGLREVVVRTSDDPLISMPPIFGATELGDGSVILIIDVAGLYQYWRTGESMRAL